jgi:hypothetical protein
MAKTQDRKIIQFYQYEGSTIALCSDGAVFAVQSNYDKGAPTTRWVRRPELEMPVEVTKE